MADSIFIESVVKGLSRSRRVRIQDPRPPTSRLIALDKLTNARVSLSIKKYELVLPIWSC